MTSRGRTVYVAGPMTGYQGYNFPAFNGAEERLKLFGYDVLNPARHGAGQTWEWYMRADIRHVLDADAIYLLPGWEASRGARLEVHVAHALGVPTIAASAWSRDTLPGWGAPSDICMIPACGCVGEAHP